jgi:hypothetical protein
MSSQSIVAQSITALSRPTGGSAVELASDASVAVTDVAVPKTGVAVTAIYQKSWV